MRERAEISFYLTDRNKLFEDNMGRYLKMLI